MQFIKVRSFLLVVMLGLGAAFISPGALGMMTPALAQINTQPEGIVVGTWDTGLNVVQMLDLDGNIIGNGTHVGKIRCKNKCSQKTYFEINLPNATVVSYQLTFHDRIFVDQIERRVVAGGSGTAETNGIREKITFSVEYFDNGDGTMRSQYFFSTPNASVSIPNTSGELSFR